MSGLITLAGCRPPTISDPIFSCVTTNKFQSALCGERSFDYQGTPEKTGEWIDSTKLELKSTEEMPDMMCVGLEDWLTKVKPRMKETSIYFHNHYDQNN